MNEFVESNDRQPFEFVLFAVVFFSILSAAGSVVLDMPVIALFFAAVIVLCVTFFAVAREE